METFSFYWFEAKGSPRNPIGDFLNLFYSNDANKKEDQTTLDLKEGKSKADTDDYVYDTKYEEKCMLNNLFSKNRILQFLVKSEVGQNDCNCGQTSDSDGSRIVGGKAAMFGHYPLSMAIKNCG